MNNQVLIAENSTTGKVCTEFNYVDKVSKETKTLYKLMVTQSSLTASNGIFRESKRTAFVTLDEKAYGMFERAGLLRDGAPLPLQGKLVITETLEPYMRKDGTPQKPKINPTTQEVITHQGAPVYRNTEFTQDLNAVDTFLASDRDDNSASASEEVVE